MMSTDLPRSWDGMAHSSDWYVTFVQGIAGEPFPEESGPRRPDGHNQPWASLSLRFHLHWHALNHSYCRISNHFVPCR